MFAVNLGYKRMVLRCEAVSTLLQNPFQWPCPWCVLIYTETERLDSPGLKDAVGGNLNGRNPVGNK